MRGGSLGGLIVALGGNQVKRRGKNADRLVPAPINHSARKVGRNDPCPCRSGKKYKHCHLVRNT